MVDEKHLAILRKGVEVWNQWREKNPNIKPNLFGVNLPGIDLPGINLFNAYLRSANLESANLRSADLESANLRSADLESANLRSANLRSANLESASLRRANLEDAYLEDVNLRRANLEDVYLEDVDLFNANLFSTNLSSADLRRANLRRIQALNANFESAILTGACIEDWNINSQTNLQEVKCDYIYLKENKQDRRPHDLDEIFAPGEFTQLFQKALETVDLMFSEGIDWQAFLVSFNKLQIECDSDELSISSFENKGNGAFVIRVNVPDGVDKAKIEKYLKKQYQLEAKVEFQQRELANLYEVTKLLAGRPINVMASGNTYNQSGNMGIGHNEGEINDDARVAGVYSEATQQDLSQAAADIQQLLDQLAKDNPTETTPEKMMVGAKVVEEITNNPSRWQKSIKVVKAMGIEAIAEAVDNPIFNIAKAGLEAALESE